MTRGAIQRHKPWRYAFLLASLGWIFSPGQGVSAKQPAQGFQIEPIGANQPAHDEIVVWQRTPGQYSVKKRPARTKAKPFKLAKIKHKTVKLKDIQYHKTLWFKGFYVKDLLRQYRRPKSIDLAILHFSNGVAIPYPLKGTTSGKNKAAFRVFVATSLKQGKKWTSKFPDLRKKDVLFRDHNPIKFLGNKVVVTSSWHPAVSQAAAKDLNVWRYPGALRGIELVQKAAYYGQYAVSNRPPVKRGLKLFRESCQFCHGSRKVGASFGRDFTMPVSVHLYMNRPAHLRHHIRNRSLFATREGLMMPGIKQMTKQEAESLWMWMKALWTSHKLKPYKPSTK